MQLFHYGDLVHIAKDLGQAMSRFTANCDAIVLGSYRDSFGGGNTKSYTLHLKGSGEHSWYEEHQLTLIEKGRIDLLKQWKTEEETERSIKGNLDWIFSNGPAVLANPHSASIQRLARCFGMDNLWGNHGEGYTYYQNAMLTLYMASPFLESGDKDGWLECCKALKKEP